MRAAIQRTVTRLNDFAATQRDQTIYVAVAQVFGALITLHDEMSMFPDSPPKDETP